VPARTWRRLLCHLPQQQLAEQACSATMQAPSPGRGTPGGGWSATSRSSSWLSHMQACSATMQAPSPGGVCTWRRLLRHLPQQQLAEPHAGVQCRHAGPVAWESPGRGAHLAATGHPAGGPCRRGAPDHFII